MADQINQFSNLPEREDFSMTGYRKIFDIHPSSVREAIQEHPYQDNELEWLKRQLEIYRERLRTTMDTLHALPQNTLAHIIHETGLMDDLRDDQYKSMKIDIYSKALAQHQLTDKQRRVLVNIICNQ
ncbi:hypothetical protein [Bacillus phage phiAGATE]|uniref:Uncharacterized protein n=1 Tax=Bacillus phage phiAGATE TaxID=1204533 RepID=L0LCB3_9CAUD|nr:hypothetical protein G380_gp096 [Bacillus phage phiAGATE]AGB62746.1 hypothetical protein [Bacillus phage phiAGATE]